MENLCYSANKESEDAYDVSTSLAAEAILASSTSKFGIGTPLTEHEDLDHPLNQPIPLL